MKSVLCLAVTTCFLASATAVECKDTGFVCSGSGTSYCTTWSSRHVGKSECMGGHCMYPPGCSRSGSSDSLETYDEPSPGDSLLDVLLARLLASGEDQDDVPAHFTALVKKVETDKPEKHADFDVGSLVNVFTALGYKNVKRVSVNNWQMFFDDEITVTTRGDKGKSVAYGTRQSDSFSIRVCFDETSGVSLAKRLVLVNGWNEKYRMSTAFASTDDESVCIQSDHMLTKYADANVQIAKEAGAYLAVSAQAFHVKWAILLALHDEL